MFCSVQFLAPTDLLLLIRLMDIFKQLIDLRHIALVLSPTTGRSTWALLNVSNRRLSMKGQIVQIKINSISVFTWYDKNLFRKN